MQTTRITLQSLQVAGHFAQARWWLNFRDRDRLERWQQKRLAHFLHSVVPRAPRFRGFASTRLHDLPCMDKAQMMADFGGYNTQGVGLEMAMPLALAAEQSRDFSPLLGELTVGLSSGTSGHRGLFLVSPAERLRWAGILLARALPPSLLGRLLSPWQPPLRVAFFLRANSNLYTTLNSRRIDFQFFDLLDGVAPALPRLQACQPDVLVAPATVLGALAREALAGNLTIRPHRVISVAEVLEHNDAALVLAAFAQPTHQLYQATEGFLGYTCEAGTLHLNESFVHIEPEWLDTAHTRFQPIITDFSRHTQLIVRYRLNDVLRIGPLPCACGRAERAIAAVEGRSDEVLWLPHQQGGQPVAIYPDVLRRAMLMAGNTLYEYTITQRGLTWCVALQPAAGMHLQHCVPEVSQALGHLCAQHQVQPPQLSFHDWKAPAPGAKRRRIRLESQPEGFSCVS